MEAQHINLDHYLGSSLSYNFYHDLFYFRMDISQF